MNARQVSRLWRIAVAVVMVVVLLVWQPEGWLRLSLFVSVYLLIGYDILFKAWHGVTHGRMLDENFLMVVATLGVFGLAAYERSGDYMEAVAVMLFYQIGEFLQGYAVDRSRKSIASLMDLRPDYANIEVGDTVERVDPDEVEVGSTIVVRPGEKVPIDGVVVSGGSSLNTSSLTGESRPVDVGEGDEVLSGSVNVTGVLRLRTTKEFGESTVSKILELVEDSASHKAPAEEFISKFAYVYTPIVCLCALALAVVPPTVMALVGQADWAFSTYGVWVYRALVFLVVSCPCALVVSIPLSFFAGIGGASREGILIKGANIMELLSKAKTVVFDKTGTLTKGVFEVLSATSPEVLEMAALAECDSSHPIGKSLLRAYGKEVDRRRVQVVSEEPGRGVVAVVDGRTLAVGGEKMMKSRQVSMGSEDVSGTLVYVAEGQKLLGHVVLGDVVKETSAQAVGSLKQSGVERVAMMTGDTASAALPAAKAIGIEEVYSSMLPADKLGKVVEMVKGSGADSKVVFVGDGVNDAPVLMSADVGIAMGGVGSDAAIEAADVVLMDDDPLKVGKAVRISRKSLRIVRQNIVFALGVKVLCLVLGALGLAGMWLAIFADVGVMVLAVLNSMRAMYVRRV